jgi:hypothetical protein
MLVVFVQKTGHGNPFYLRETGHWIPKISFSPDHFHNRKGIQIIQINFSFSAFYLIKPKKGKV